MVIYFTLLSPTYYAQASSGGRGGQLPQVHAALQDHDEQPRGRLVWSLQGSSLCINHVSLAMCLASFSLLAFVSRLRDHCTLHFVFLFVSGYFIFLSVSVACMITSLPL